MSPIQRSNNFLVVLVALDLLETTCLACPSVMGLLK